MKGDIASEEFILIKIKNCEEEGSRPAKIMHPLRSLLTRGIHLKSIKVYVEVEGERLAPVQDLFYCCLLAVISAIPSKVESLIIEIDFLGPECCLDDEVVLEFLKSIVLDPKNSLQYLELSGFTIGNDSLHILGQMLSDPVCQLEGFSLADSFVPNIAYWIRSYLNKTRLTLLDLSFIQNGFKADPAAVELAEVLKHHPTLKFLNISYNDISNRGAEAIAEALKHNQVLEYLDFTNSSIGEAALVKFGNALETNKTLAILCLSHQEYCDNPEANAPLDQSAIAFGQAFKVNQSLVYLALRREYPTEVGIEALRQGLLQNRALQVCDITTDRRNYKEFKEILTSKKRIREKQDLLWIIWEEYGDVLRPVQSVARSVFAGCDFKPMQFTNAKGQGPYRIGNNTDLRGTLIKIARRVGFFNTAITQTEVNISASSPSNTEYDSYFQWLPREMVEDTFELALSSPDAVAVKQEGLKRKLPDNFWQENRDSKHCKIEDEKEELPESVNSL